MNITFDLPDDLIAVSQVQPRDQCKLFVFDRKTKTIEHKTFSDLPSYLNAGDLLIANQAKVSPRRIYWTHPDQRQLEIVFLSMIDQRDDFSFWQALVSGKKLKENFPYWITQDVCFEIKERKDKVSLIKVNKSPSALETLFEQKAFLPIPPYIQKRRLRNQLPQDDKRDIQDYQTVFASKKGAVAAPTAGLHFTPNLIEQIKNKDVFWEEIFLEVGWGTFAPVTEKNFASKTLHHETIEIKSQITEQIQSVKKESGKVVAVGTTVVRSMETWASKGFSNQGFSGQSDLFIFPPYSFQVVDALVTNFHLPGSSLLLLVSAFLGKGGAETIKALYQEAIEKKYRFYSYGDAMLIL